MNLLLIFDKEVQCRITSSLLVNGHKIYRTFIYKLCTICILECNFFQFKIDVTN